jgi:O-antigen/teichoic acid export membrane protein
MSSLNRFFKDSLIYGVAAVLPRIINFLMVRLHTDALPAAAYAINTDFYIWAALISIVLTLGFETTFFRFFKEPEYKDKLIATSFLTISAVIVVFILVFSLFFRPIQTYFHFEGHDLRLQMFIAIMALDTLAMIPFAYLRAVNRPIRYTTIKLINVFVIVILQLITLRWIPNGQANGIELPAWLMSAYHKIPLVDNIFFSNLLGSAMSFMLVLPYLTKAKWIFDKDLLKKMLVYSYPIVIAGLAYAINENLDKWLIGEYVDKYSEGLYAAAYKLAIFMNLYIMAFRLGAEPFFFKISVQKDAQVMYAKIMKYFVSIGSIALMGVVLFIDIFKHMINPDYWTALNIVPIVLLANLFLGIYHNLSIWYKLIDKTRYGMWFSIIGAVLTIALNVLFLKEYGYMVAAWATLTAYGVMSLLSYLVGQKKYPIAYDLKPIIVLLSFSTFISFFFYYVYKPQLWLSFIILIVYIGILIMTQLKDIKSDFKSLK